MNETIEFQLTAEQVVRVGDRPTEAHLPNIVGSVQRRKHPAEPKLYFSGRWLSGPQAQKLRDAAKKLTHKRKPKTTETK